MSTLLHSLPREGALVNLFPFLRWLRLVTLQTLRRDLIAAATGAVIVLPQGIAFALIAGLPPEYGLYTAIVIPVVAGLFGSSRHLVSGPTTAISIVILEIVSTHAPPGSTEYIGYVLTLTFLAGLFQFLLGLARMGGLVNFISHTVVIGFTAGAAVLIAVSQLGNFFGMPVQSGESFLQALEGLVRGWDNSNPYVIIIAVATLISTLLVRRFRPHWPAMLIGMMVGSLICLLLRGQEHGVPLVGSLPGSLPPLSLPDFSVSTLQQLAPGALAVAMLGLIEATSIARAVATRSHQRIDGNQEFIGQGLSNMVGSFFSCYAASGSFTRTGVNYEAGAKTPLSAIFASLLVALVVVFLAPLTAYLPIPATAGVIMVVAWNLVDAHHIRQIARTSAREATVMIVTFLATLLLDLEFAIYVGVLLSLVLYLQRTSHPRIIELAPNPERPRRAFENIEKQRLLECPQLKIIRLDGSLFFGAVDHVQHALHRLAERGWNHVLIIGDSINFIDVAGAEMLVQEAQRLRQRGGGLYLCGLKDSARRLLDRGGYTVLIRQENFFYSKEEAVRHIFQRLDFERCSICTRRIFQECDTVEFHGEGLMH